MGHVLKKLMAPPGVQPPAQRRALLGGWHVAAGLGISEVDGFFSEFLE